MRRSKSNPAKYARNYKSISQRRMTAYDDDDDGRVNDDEEERAEMERLRTMLRNSHSHLKNGKTSARRQGDDSMDDGVVNNNNNNIGGDKKKRRRQPSNDNNSGEETQEDLSSRILSEEIRQDVAYGGNEKECLVLLPSKKKKKKQSHSKHAVELTPQEIRQAKLLQKNTFRKLKQLSERTKQKQRRTELYTKLQQTAISTTERQLLSSSSTLGQRQTKRETLKRLVQKERAGMTLTTDEQNMLYQERQVHDNNSATSDNNDQPATTIRGKDNNTADDEKDGPLKRPEQTDQLNKKKRKKRGQGKVSDEKVFESESEEPNSEAALPDSANSTNDESTRVPIKPPTVEVDRRAPPQQEKSQSSTITPMNFATQMMASISNLKVKTMAQNEEQDDLDAKQVERIETERLQQEKQRREHKRYVPSDPIVLKSPANLERSPGNVMGQGTRRKVLEVNRPADIASTRYDLPVCGMEYEIVDAIRNNDTTIICGETGSGKSTQVPQFLYEAGFASNESNDNGGLLIGVTQPRRVAAVSTAKRVCYEMGHGDGRRIKNGQSKEGNPIAYQTRYETAGLGPSTRIKFMTDGILLQEIQSDLLLRKYGAIVLDEAHERNLNTDVLLGLLSVAVPLRKKAALEEGSEIPPLKLVIMSATLRVEDFTENSRLFPDAAPAVVKVPGRTHPVTIHHTKITELDDYETATFNKICKIHRKLPKGGILVFLTGKQEIVRMVNKLRRALGCSMTLTDRRTIGNRDVSRPRNDEGSDIVPRDLDDEEIDGDIFVDEGFEYLDYAEIGSEKDGEDAGVPMSRHDPDDNIPKRVLVLPLYSMLSAEEQARVFDNVPEGYRLIVVATNIAETSVTIPDISYVVDCGRQKCRNYHAGTGVASYDVMWISRAAADQRAGRAGRTGPGHCYRMYSSSMYSRHMSSFALPEVLTRPLEDVILAMKAMNVSNVARFPFPTAPDQSQLDASMKLLSNIGCLDLSNVEKKGGDGDITRLGAAVAQLPLGVRHGKMLLVAGEAGILDYAIIMVAVQSEASPFRREHSDITDANDQDNSENECLDEIDRNAAMKQEEQTKKEIAKTRWTHRGGDILAAVHAVGAYTYAGRGAGGATEKVANRTFCEENGLNPVVMERIQKMRFHLARLAKNRLSKVESVASKTGGILYTMPPPNKLQENLLLQAIASGLLDNVAVLSPLGSITGDHHYSLRSAYLSCSTSTKEPLYMDRNSVLFSRDSRRLPQWVCFDSIVRKETKDGGTIANMKNVSPIDPSWIGSLAKGTDMLSLGEPLPSPLPSYDADQDTILCSVSSKFGSRGWEIPPVQLKMLDALQRTGATKSGHFWVDDSFRWFARFLLEGKVLPELRGLSDLLNDEPSIITRKKPLKKVALLVSALSSAGIDSAHTLRKHWAEVDDKFLFAHLKSWASGEHKTEVKRLWIAAVKSNVTRWNEMRP